MKIKEILRESNNDFSSIMVCEHCGSEQQNNRGYHDNYYHTKIIPAMFCQSCGRDRSGEREAKEQK